MQHVKKWFCKSVCENLHLVSPPFLRNFWKNPSTWNGKISYPVSFSYLVIFCGDLYSINHSDCCSIKRYSTYTRIHSITCNQRRRSRARMSLWSWGWLFIQCEVVQERTGVLQAHSHRQAPDSGLSTTRANCWCK